MRRSATCWRFWGNTDTFWSTLLHPFLISSWHWLSSDFDSDDLLIFMSSDNHWHKKDFCWGARSFCGIIHDHTKKLLFTRLHKKYVSCLLFCVICFFLNIYLVPSFWGAFPVSVMLHVRVSLKPAQHKCVLEGLIINLAAEDCTLDAFGSGISACAQALACMLALTHTQACTHTCTHACTRTCTHARVHMHTHTHTHTHRCTQMHTHSHTHTHIHTHTHTSSMPLPFIWF